MTTWTLDPDTLAGFSWALATANPDLRVTSAYFGQVDGQAIGGVTVKNVRSGQSWDFTPDGTPEPGGHQAPDHVASSVRRVLLGDPVQTPTLESPRATRTGVDRVALAESQAAHGIRQDALDGRVVVHHSTGTVGDTDTLWGDYPFLVPWREISGKAGGWVVGNIGAHWPDVPGAVDLRGLPGQHGMPSDRALGPLVQLIRSRSVGVHLVTDGPADLVARVLPGWVGPC